jgi:hypothetical protein
MKKCYPILVIILIMSTIGACSGKKSSSNKKGTTSPVTIPNPIPNPVPDPTPNPITCDGVARNGVTRCYYKNIPTILASGGTSGQQWWSSTNFITTSGNSPGQFSTDATFNVRIIPRTSTATGKSTFNKDCSPYRMYATKLKVQLMLHKNGVSVGEIATLTSTIGTPSNVWHFTVPATSDPLVLEVINVTSDSRCTGFYGSKPSSCETNPYLDIPINTTGPTECVAFDIQYSTDETYDLPGTTAN